MAVNFDVLLQPPVFDFFAVPITVLPIASQPAVSGGYAARGILNTYGTDVVTLDGSNYSDQRTILDIRDSEFSIIPIQLDHVIIPEDSNDVPKGEYIIVDLISDGGGQTMLVIKKYETFQ
jgi:hypothetical protein